MPNTTRRIMPALVLVAAAAAAWAAVASTVLKQCAFTKNTEGWRNWRESGCGAACRWDKTVGHDKPGSLCVDLAKANGKGMCFYTTSIAAKPGVTYKAVGWAKTEGVDKEAKVTLYVRWQNKKRGWLPGKHGITAAFDVSKTNEEWRKQEKTFSVPKDIEAKVGFMSCMFTVNRAKAGKAWFDDFELSEVPAEK